MKKILNYSVVLFVLTIILLLIIPLPAGMVDVAIILNMALSMMILVSTMTIREPLELSIFPSLLLVTTLSGLASMFLQPGTFFPMEVPQARL